MVCDRLSGRGQPETPTAAGPARRVVRNGASSSRWLSVVGERELLGVRLEEEVERIDDRHLGHQIHLEREASGRLGNDEPRQEVSLRVLLPVDEVLLRLDSQRVTRHRRTAVRRRAAAARSAVTA